MAVVTVTKMLKQTLHSRRSEFCNSKSERVELGVTFGRRPGSRLSPTCVERSDVDVDADDTIKSVFRRAWQQYSFISRGKFGACMLNQGRIFAKNGGPTSEPN
jgi:pheromone shutdown protein TraB